MYLFLHKVSYLQGAAFSVPRYNRNGWRGVKHQITYVCFSVKEDWWIFGVKNWLVIACARKKSPRSVLDHRKIDSSSSHFNANMYVQPVWYTG